MENSWMLLKFITYGAWTGISMTLGILLFLPGNGTMKRKIWTWLSLVFIFLGIASFYFLANITGLAASASGMALFFYISRKWFYFCENCGRAVLLPSATPEQKICPVCRGKLL